MVDTTTPKFSNFTNLVELRNERRTCRSLSTLELNSSKYLLAADMMLGATNMDGKFKLISLASLLQQKNSAQDQTKIMSGPSSTLATEHFVETEAGCCVAQSLQTKTGDYVICGLEDGSLHVYNLRKNFGKSYTIPKAAGSTPLRSQT